MTSDTIRHAIAGVAGVLGAAGVALAAVAAHRVDDPKLVTAANFLIFHATAAIAVVAYAQGLEKARLLLTAAAAMLIGVALFSASIASTVFRGETLFPMSAPIGGSTLIGAWALVGLASVLNALGTRSRSS